MTDKRFLQMVGRMAAVAFLSGIPSLAPRKLTVSLPGLPLPGPTPPTQRTEAEKARKLTMRRQRRARINRRGF